MYVDVEPEGRVVVHWQNVNLVPDFKNLIASFGRNAMHYLFLWASPLSPYYRVEDKVQRHQLILNALSQVAIEKGRKVPDRLWQQAEFTLAEKTFQKLVPENEAREEALLSRTRRELANELESILDEASDESQSETKTSLREQITTIKEVMSAVSSLRKEHQAARDALNQRIQSDDSPAIILAQI